MTQGAEESMNSIKICEARALYAGCGYITVIGNGQVVAIVPENEAQDEEKRRIQNGY